jgi:transcriptional regulator with XRE-family HTH domain
MFPGFIKIDDVKKEMGAFAKSLRKREKISQQSLAERLNLSRLTIQNMESGRNFTIDTFLLVMEHFQKLNELNNWFKARRLEEEDVKSLY